MNASRNLQLFCLPVLLGTASAAPVSPVADAAMRRDGATVRRLLSEKADVNAPQADGTTALMWAARANDAALVDALIAAGANVKAANREGATALYEAAESANAQVTEKLLRAGAEVNGTFLTT